MADSRALERLPMTMGYFRLILRCFGDTPERRKAILAGTRVSEKDLIDPAAEISLFQQVRQVENVSRLYGPGWALSQPELWNPSAHGAMASAVLSAGTLSEGIDALQRYAHVRAPFFKLTRARRGDTVHLEYNLTVPLSEAEWQPMIEIAVVSVRAMLAAMLGHALDGAEFRFAYRRPAHAAKLFRALGENVSFGHKLNAIAFPKSWLGVPSAFADAVLLRNAVNELEQALARIDDPAGLQAKVEHLLMTMPDRRLGAADAARALGVSRRTLARRLEETGTPFRELLDRELKTRARAMLDAAKLSRDEMAARLGYRDPTSFSRACRRWFAT